jgi:hypothetical protein
MGFRRRYDDDGYGIGGRADVSRVTGGAAMVRVIVAVSGVVGAELEQEDAGNQQREKRRPADL